MFHQLHVHRISNTANLSALTTTAGTYTPAFSKDVFTYNATVTNSVTSVTVTPTVEDPTATIKVNSTTVANGTASGAITLNEGTNSIQIIVTAEDGLTKKTYQLIVKRQSSNANLISLTTSKGILSPTFNKSTFGYSTTIEFAVKSITVTPTSEDSTATIKVNGLVVSSGTPSSNIPLVSGVNTITVAVTAEDGSTTKQYKIDVTRLGGAKITGTGFAGSTKNNLAIKMGTTTTANISSKNTDTSGAYSFSDLEPGTYYVDITKPGYLKCTVTNISMTTQTVNLNAYTLIAGDLDANGAVNSIDIALFKNSINTVSGNSRFLNAADFNEDGRLNAADLGLLLRNIGKTSTTIDYSKIG